MKKIMALLLNFILVCSITMPLTAAESVSDNSAADMMLLNQNTQVSATVSDNNTVETGTVTTEESNITQSNSVSENNTSTLSVSENTTIQNQIPAEPLYYGWKLQDGFFYYYDRTTGILQTGITQINNRYYLLDQTTGKRLQGFQDYIDENGITRQVYAYVGGILASGLCKIDDTWYYFDEDTFFMESVDEIKEKEFIVLNGEIFYIKYGKKLTGQWNIDGSVYFFNAYGKMQTGFQTIGRRNYYFEENGDIPEKGKRISGYKQITVNEEPQFYYFNEDGIMQHGWQQFETDGEMLWHFFDYVTGIEDSAKTNAVKGKGMYYSEVLIPEEEKNNTLGTFKIHINDVLGDRDIRSVTARVWSLTGGMDDVKTYSLINDGNHNYSTTIDAKNHGYDQGTYCVRINIQDKVYDSLLLDTIETEVSLSAYDAISFSLDSCEENITASIEGARFGRDIKETGVLVWKQGQTIDNAVKYPLSMKDNGNRDIQLSVKKIGFSEEYKSLFYTVSQNNEQVLLEDGSEKQLTMTPLIIGKNGENGMTQMTDSTYGLWTMKAWATSPSTITATARVWQSGNTKNYKDVTLISDENGGYIAQMDLKDFAYVSDTYEADINIVDGRGAYGTFHLTSEKITSIFNMTMSVSTGINDTFKGRMQLIFSDYSSDSMNLVKIVAFPSSRPTATSTYSKSVTGNAPITIELDAAKHGYVSGEYTVQIYGKDSREFEVLVKTIKVKLVVSPSFISMKNAGMGVPTETGYFGIDVSHHQGTINWNAVKNSGVSFAMIRDGYGKDAGQVDRQFANNLAGVRNQGLKWGVYHYSYADSAIRAGYEADYCKSILQSRGVNSGMVAFDFEESSRRSTSKRNENTQIILAFCSKMKAAGYTPYVYADYSMITTCMDASAIRNAGIKIWVARWQNSSAGIDYNVWQFYNKGSVSGISGNVDLDFCKDLSGFNG